MKKVNLSHSLILLLSLTFLSASGFAADLSNKALFFRCYKAIAQSFPASNHPLVQQVENNQIDPIDACIQVLNKAMLTANNNRRIANTGDLEARSVLRTFHNLHYSWFTNKLLPSAQGDFLSVADQVDVSGPALYYTKALFAPNYQFKDIFTGDQNHESDRLNGRPDRGPNSNTTRADYAPTNPAFVWQEVGPIVGYQTYGARNYDATRGTDTRTMELGTNWGGGVLGSFSYVLMNVIEPRNFRANGAVGVPRKWAQSVLLDFMCRELPVIRYDDSLEFLSNDSNSATFRQEGACVRCHATMDRMAGTIRNVRPEDVASDSPRGQRVFSFVKKWATDRTGNETWSLTGDGSFYRKPLNGHFLYRTFDGRKIDRALTSVANLGQVIGDLDDPYVCAAKRYYEYFTGIEVNVDDIADPQYGRQLSSEEIAVRNDVIQLGKSFKQHQNMKRLVEEILKKPEFKDSGYRR